MSVLRLSRFTADPASVDTLLARRAALIAAVRRSHPGLREASLVRVDDRTFVDVWRWDSADAMRAAVAAAPSMPETRAAFALVADTTAEDGEILDAR
jgi:heme-degrading monooxygenase HmoA